MTFDDDMIRLELPDSSTRDFTCDKVHLTWPPPEKLNVNGVNYNRVSHSQITDDQRKDMSHVCRMALYRPA